MGHRQHPLLHGSGDSKKKKGGAAVNNPLDDIIEDARLIFQRERDGLPCSFLREILMQKLLELAQPILADRILPPARQTQNPPCDHDR